MIRTAADSMVRLPPIEASTTGRHDASTAIRSTARRLGEHHTEQESPVTRR
ncbi:hypothetical protein ITP53_07840 [Nonomuraea sp. K274]|uniref:Uncharacterized protein n=1 Tax=Nonomuraea cypriaca TaxID=1187855 RepID=A0A931A942_9ACTN|nr:hypothetical protein [Nonomuraea cypriaca]MBF8185650.1 hypothetical protein [Nonomuraea cypriaca]